MAVRFSARQIGRLVIISTILQLLSQAWATDHNKRAPSGFTGVRGKKSSYSDSNERSYELLPPDDTKQALPARNTNYGEETRRNSWYARDFGYKRGPMGFVGMRGKKELFPSYNYQDALSKEIQKIKFNCKFDSDNFRCNDLKPEALTPLIMEISQNNADEETNTGEDNFGGWAGQPNLVYGSGFEIKRSPLGFMGMRGKKYMEDNNFLKRAPSGFMGMRGKKDLITGNPSLHVFNEPEQVMEDTAFISKRAPQSGFFGMRGKKMPGNSGFFGMRGKKGPYDFPFRGKFVGVRGKKSIYDAIENQVDGSNAGV